jgi:hypothetical protein
VKKELRIPHVYALPWVYKAAFGRPAAASIADAQYLTQLIDHLRPSGHLDVLETCSGVWSDLEHGMRYLAPKNMRAHIGRYLKTDYCDSPDPDVLRWDLANDDYPGRSPVDVVIAPYLSINAIADSDWSVVDPTQSKLFSRLRQAAHKGGLLLLHHYTPAHLLEVFGADLRPQEYSVRLPYDEPGMSQLFGKSYDWVEVDVVRDLEWDPATDTLYEWVTRFVARGVRNLRGRVAVDELSVTVDAPFAFSCPSTGALVKAAARQGWELNSLFATVDIDWYDSVDRVDPCASPRMGSPNWLAMLAI